MKKRIDLRSVLWILGQGVFVVVWIYFVSRFELYSVEGYCYNKFNGLYFLCGAASIASLWDNLRHPVSGSPRRRMAVGSFSLLFSLATVMANYPTFEPFGELKNMVCFILTLTGGTMVGWQILHWALGRLPLKQVTGTEGRDHPVRFFLICFVSIGAVYLMYFIFAAYPGCFTRDSFSAIAQGLSGRYDNTSPFWHTMVVKACMEVGELLGGEGNSAVWVYGIVQSLAMAAVFSCVLVTLYQVGMPKWSIAAVYFAYGLLSYNIVYSVTMWKDIPFSLGALLTVTGLYRILKGIGKSRRLNWVLFAIGSIFFCMMRTNGWYSYLVTAGVVALAVYRYQKKLVAIMCAVLVLGWLCNGPVLDMLGVAETNFVEALAIPFQQIGRVVVDECEIDEEDMEIIEAVFDTDRIRDLYNPLTVDPMKFQALEDREYLKDNFGAFIGMWLRGGARHPWEYTKAWIDETQGYWNAGYNYWVYPEGDENPELGITRPGLDNPVKDLYEKWFHFLESTPPITQPLYGIGFQVWLLFLCLIVNGMKGRREYLLAVPCAVIVAGLWFGTPVFSEFRYAYPVFVTVPFLLCTTAFRAENAAL